MANDFASTKPKLCRLIYYNIIVVHHWKEQH